MIIDSSALIAILRQEPEAKTFLQKIVMAETCEMSSGNFFEASIVIQTHHGDSGLRDLDSLIATYKIQIVDFTEQQAGIARRAYRRYGKGIHPASLNFGDCMAYALAKDTGEPLLFKGDDFEQTDIAAAIV